MIDPNFLLGMYAQGVFPMAHEDGEIYWYDPDPRAVLEFGRFHIPRRLKRTIKQQPYEIVLDRDFRGTMWACAESAAGRETTWIDQNIVESYCLLHEHGFAHSVEAYREGELVGGLYGVSLRGLFAGESMFSRSADASKICLVTLIDHLQGQGFTLLDVQFHTDHLARFGISEIPQAEYKKRLAHAMEQDVCF